MLPGEVTRVEWHQSFLLDEIHKFETPTTKSIPALNNDLKFFLLQTNHLLQAKQHLIKTMQNKRFCNELSFLKDPTKGITPPLVKNLNVFMDQEGILRVDGRIANSSRYRYEFVFFLQYSAYKTPPFYRMSDR